MMSTGDFEAALTEVRRAIALDPESAYAYMTLATLPNFAGQPEQALVAVERSLDLSPEPVMLSWITFHEGLAHFLLRDYDEEVAVFRSLLNANPDLLPTHLFLAATYAEMGDLERARASANEVLRINPGYTVATLEQRMRYRDPDELARVATALRQAGVPD